MRSTAASMATGITHVYYFEIRIREEKQMERGADPGGIELFVNQRPHLQT